MSGIASELNNIDLDDGARAEIQQALVNGLEVITHQSPITVNGWQGSGYSIINPEYGMGAYKISGGFYSMIEAIDDNSGKIAIASFLLSSIFGSAVVPLVGPIAMIGVFVSLVLVFTKISVLLAENGDSPTCNTGIQIIAYVSSSFAALGLIRLLEPMVALVTNLIVKNAVPATLCN